MAGTEYKLSSIYPSRKPFMEDNGKRRKSGPDLRVQALLAQEAKRQCLAAGEHGAADGQQPPKENLGPADGDGSRQLPATDFAGFFQTLKEQGDQQGGQQQQPAYLDQLLSQHSLAAVARPPMELQSMLGLDRTFPPDGSRDRFTREAPAAGGQQQQQQQRGGGGSCGAAAAAAAQEERWHLTQLQLLPWDWSAKSRVRLASPAPFAALDEQRAAGLGPACAAVSTLGQCKAQQSNQERLAAALLQWQHPASPLSQPQLAALRSADKEGAAAGEAGGRAGRWREALRGAYSAVRHGHLPALYVTGQVFRQPFTAVFCAPGVMGCGRLHAVLSRSNKPLRDHLASYGAAGVLAGSLEQPASTGARRMAAAVRDGQPGSQLLLAGARRVHGLYAALLALPWCAPEQPDVPLLAAPAPFLHAQLCRLRLEALPDAVLERQQQQQQQQQAGDSGGAAPPAAGAPAPLHYAEVSPAGGCPVMPWSLHRLLRVVSDTQGSAGVDVHMETQPCSSGLNLPHDTWQAAAVTMQQQRQQQQEPPAREGPPQRWQVQQLGVSAEERQGWQASAALLQGRALRQLRIRNGEVSARLA